MPLGLVDKLLDLVLGEAMHQLAGFGSNVRLRIGVKYSLHMNLAYTDL